MPPKTFWSGKSMTRGMTDTEKPMAAGVFGFLSHWFPGRRNTPGQYLVVSALMAVALAMRFAIAPLDGGVQYVTFFPAVALAAVLGGLWPGLFAAAIGMTLATYLFWPLYQAWSFDFQRHMMISNVVFLIDALLVCSAIETMHRYYQRFVALEKEQRLAASVFHNSEEGVMITDTTGTIHSVNPAFTKITGYAADEVIGKTPSVLRSGHHEAGYFKAIWDSLVRDRRWEGEIWNRRKNGETYVQWTIINAVPGNDGKPVNYVCVFHDISERRRVEQVLHENAERLQAHMENSPMAIIGWDSEFKTTQWSGEAERIFGWSAAETLGKPIMDLHMIVEEDIPLVQQAMAKMLDGASRYVISSNRNHTKDGRVIHCVWYNSVLTTEDGRMTSVMSQVLDVTEQKHAERELKRIAQTDMLTGLANRRHFMELAELELSRACRYGDPLTVLMLDIDQFKRVNDTHGHQTGDRVIQSVGRLCHETLREVDVIGRIGGEEFAIILPQTGSEQAVEAAERLREVIANSEIPMKKGMPLHCTVSIGVATMVDTMTNLDTLLGHADKSLYDAKQAGRNRVGIHASNPRPAPEAGRHERP